SRGFAGRPLPKLSRIERRKTVLRSSRPTRPCAKRVPRGDRKLGARRPVVNKKAGTVGERAEIVSSFNLSRHAHIEATASTNRRFGCRGKTGGAGLHSSRIETRLACLIVLRPERRHEFGVLGRKPRDLLGPRLRLFEGRTVERVDCCGS